MTDGERVAVSVLKNRTTQGWGEQNSTPFWSLVSTGEEFGQKLSWFQVALKWA